MIVIFVIRGLSKRQVAPMELKYIEVHYFLQTERSSGAFTQICFLIKLVLFFSPHPCPSPKERGSLVQIIINNSIIYKNPVGVYCL
jgi:hypothetical protein